MRARRELLVIGWVAYHSRNEGFAAELGGETVYLVWGPRGSALVAAARYVVQSVMTIVVLTVHRPRRVIVMLPPFPALLIGVLYGRLTGAPVVGDVHSYPLLAPVWRPFLRFTAWLLRNGAGAVVTNDGNAEILRAHAVETIVVHDRPQLAPGREQPVARRDPLIVIPSSFDPDEPVEEVLDAAATLPELEFVFTGSDHRRRLDRLTVPDNVRITGYLARPDYEQLVASATVICALTTLPDCMQAAGYEAMGFARPLVTSDSVALRQYFGRAALYTEPSSAAIRDAIRSAVERAPELHGAMVELGERKAAARPAELGCLARMLERSTGPLKTAATER